MTCAAAFAQQPRIDTVSPSQGPIAGGTVKLIQIGSAAAEFLYVPPKLQDVPPGYIAPVAAGPDPVSPVVLPQW